MTRRAVRPSPLPVSDDETDAAPTERPMPPTNLSGPGETPLQPASSSHSIDATAPCVRGQQVAAGYPLTNRRPNDR